VCIRQDPNCLPVISSACEQLHNCSNSTVTQRQHVCVLATLCADSLMKKTDEMKAAPTVSTSLDKVNTRHILENQEFFGNLAT